MTDTTVVKSDGIEMFGLYFEAVEQRRFDQRARRYWRVFIVNDHVFVYARDVGKKATTWRRFKFADHDGARQRVKDILQGSSATHFVLRGEPVLVQLKATDVIALSEGQAPPARYTGMQQIERTIGKFDADLWAAATEAEKGGTPV